MPNRSLIALLLLVLSLPLGAQDTSGETADTPEAPAIALEDVQQSLEALAGQDAGSAALFEQAIEALMDARDAAQRTQHERERMTQAPARLQEVRAELESGEQATDAPLSEQTTLQELEAALSEANTALQGAREWVIALEKESTTRRVRRDELPGLIGRERQRLTEADDRIENGRFPDTNDASPEARRTLVLAQRERARATLLALETELASIDARRHLLEAQLELAERRVGEAEARAEAVRTRVDSRREAQARDAARQAEELEREAARAHPVLRAYAEENRRLAELRTGEASIPSRQSRADRELASTRALISELRSRYASIRARIERSGLNRATGRQLRREFDTLPDQSTLTKQVSFVTRELDNAEYVLIVREEARDSFGDTEQALTRLLERLDEQPIKSATVRVARELVEARHGLAAELLNDVRRYRQVLIDLDTEGRQALQATRAFEDFVRARILWVPSVTNNRPPTASDVTQALGRMTDRATWSEAIGRAIDDVLVRPVSTGSLVFAVLIAFVGSRLALRRLTELAMKVSLFRSDAFHHTTLALIVTLLAAIPVPLALWTLGWILGRPTAQNTLGDAYAHGLITAGLVILPLELLRIAIKPDGLAEAHFRWNAPALGLIRRHLRWLTPVIGAMCVVVVASLSIASDTTLLPSEMVTDRVAPDASIGRLTFTLGMIALSIFFQRTLRPRGPVLNQFLSRREGGWIERLRFVWYPAIVALPAALAVLSWLGYSYTALQLATRLSATLGLTIGLLFANGLLMRWLFIARRRVAFEDARRRREQAMAEAANVAKEEGPTESTVPPIDVDTLNLPAISQQTKQLFGSLIIIGGILGFSGIWSEVLPALRMLERVQVYPEVSLVERESLPPIAILEPVPEDATPDAPATPATRSEMPSPSLTDALGAPFPSVDPGSSAPATVTLADLGVAMLILIATVILFRNLPGLVEIAVLQRLPLDAGSRFALSTVLRYLIGIVGLIAASSAANLAWSDIQWLAAALTFGLAFGLQEIFANFVSGLIILAERPIRIGDTVTAGNVTGTVTRIRMRATTITDWDRKELVIPNKTFITNDVINWTLSDTVLRLIIGVGVSYETDVREAERLLVQIAKENPNVMSEPAPYALFTGFGDSTLDFELRYYIDDLGLWLSSIHELRMRIVEVFREEGIEIAFPQRDLHMRSIGDLKDMIIPRNASAEDRPEKPGDERT